MKKAHTHQSEVIEDRDPTTMPLNELFQYIEQLQAIVSGKEIIPVNDDNCIISADSNNEKSNDEFETVRLCISVSKRDARLLKEHRSNTGETASGFVRRMISQEL